MTADIQHRLLAITQYLSLIKEYENKEVESIFLDPNLGLTQRLSFLTNPELEVRLNVSERSINQLIHFWSNLISKDSNHYSLLIIFAMMARQWTEINCTKSLVRKMIFDEISCLEFLLISYLQGDVNAKVLQQLLTQFVKEGESK